MTTAACNGFQCPRCFIYPAPGYGQITLGITNCNAVQTFPNNGAGPYATTTAVVSEYLFVFLGISTADRLTVSATAEPTNTFILTSSGNYIRKVYCSAGFFYDI